MLLDGIHIPLTTPFYPDGRLNPRKLEHNVDRFSRTPAAGLLILGPLGEPTTLSDADTREALTAAISAAAPEKVMLAGIAREGVSSILELAEYAAAASYDVVVLSVPSILTPSQTREAITFLQAIADRSPLPIILQSSPSNPISLETITELASHPTIIGVVEKASRPGAIRTLRERTAHIRHTAMVTTIFAAVTTRMKTKALTPIAGAATYVGVHSLQSSGTAVAIAAPPAPPALKTRTRETGFQILTGPTTSILQAFRDGAIGAIAPLAACAPQACYEILAAWKDGDQSLAEEKQNRLLAAATRIEQHLGIPGLKYAADLNGYFGGHPRLPLLPVSAAEKSEIELLMRPMRN